MFQEDPNEEIAPDYALDEHHEARQQLIAEGFNEEQAIRSLTSLWTIQWLKKVFQCLWIFM
jgi:hypothetical protein